MAFDEESTKILVDLFQTYPERQEEILAGMKARGMDTSQVNEILPLNLGAEMGQVGKGLMEGLSFGAIDAGPNDIRAGDVEVPFFGEVSPSRFGGNVAGSLPFGIGSYLTAGRLAAKAGLTGGSAKLAQVIGGEALPGAAEGIVSSRGDLGEAARHAAIWTSVGLMTEGTFTVLSKALKRSAMGNPLTAAQRKAVDKYESIKKSVGDRYDAEVDKYTPEWYKRFKEMGDDALALEADETPLAPPSVTARVRGQSGVVYKDISLGGDYDEGLKRLDQIVEESLESVEPEHAVLIRTRITQLNKKLTQLVGEGSLSGPEATDILEDMLNGKNIDQSLREFDLPEDIEDELADLKDNPPEVDIDEASVDASVEAELLAIRNKAVEGDTPSSGQGINQPSVRAADFVPREGQTVRVTSPSGKQTFEGTIEDTAEDHVFIRNHKSDKGRWVDTTKWKVSDLRSGRSDADVGSDDLPYFHSGQGSNQSGVEPKTHTLDGKEVTFLHQDTGENWAYDTGDGVERYANRYRFKPIEGRSQGRTQRGGRADQTDFSIDEDAGAAPRRDAQGNILEIETEYGITEKQAGEVLTLENRIAQEGYEIPDGPKPTEGMSLGDARVRIAKLRDALNDIQNQAHRRALRNVLQEEIDPRMLKDEFDIEKGVDPAKMTRAQRAQYENYKDNKPTRNTAELRTAKDPAVTMWTDPDDELIELKSPGLVWYMRILPPISRWGLGSNPRTKTRVVDAMDTLELIGRDTHTLLQRMKGALGQLQPSRMDRAKGFLGRSSGVSASEEAQTLKNALFRALDSDAATANRILTEEGESVLVPAYNQLRGILDEVADVLGLEQGERISQYFPHIFDGKSGSWRANRVLQELGSRGKTVEGLLPNPDGSPSLPRARKFANTLAREGAEGYSKDLESTMYAYIRGAVDKRYMDPLMGRVNKTMASLPKVDQNGQPLHTAEELRKWFAYVVGQPTQWKHIQAQWWRNNDMFNRWVDNAVEWLGNAEEKGLMELARKGRKRAIDGKRIPYTDQEEAQVVAFFDKLIRDADHFESFPGSNRAHLKPTDKRLKIYRARLALMIDDMRAALSDPAGKPILLEKLYGMMVVNKLGLSFSHGLMNATQTLTNVVPTLGVKYTSRGVKHYVEMNNPLSEIDGRKVMDIIEESGIRADFPEAKEFVPEGIGLWQDIDDMLMTPATLSEEFNRTVTLMGQYEKSIVEEGLDHAHALAKARQLVRKTHFSFNRAGTPPILHSPLARFLLMFKSYTMHQTNFSAELLADALNGNPGPFMKHMLSYATMAGVGATILGPEGLPTNFGEASQHPALGLLPNKGRGPMETIGGPPSSALLEALHGQYSQALSEMTVPTIEKRVSRAVREDNPLAALGLAP